MTDDRFELRVQAKGESQYGLALFQKSHRANGRGRKKDAGELVAKVQGPALRPVLDQVLTAIKRAGYKASELSRTRTEPFELPETLGVRLGLLFLAIRPLRKSARIGDISEQVQGMTEEEAYYWFSKTTSSKTGPRAQRALRLLLADES
jgi:hypothetical protein